MIKYWSKTMRSLETLKQFIRKEHNVVSNSDVCISGMPSKEAVLAGIYRKCGNSPTLNVSRNKSIRSHFRTIE